MAHVTPREQIRVALDQLFVFDNRSHIIWAGPSKSIPIIQTSYECEDALTSQFWSVMETVIGSVMGMVMGSIMVSIWGQSLGQSYGVDHEVGHTVSHGVSHEVSNMVSHLSMMSSIKGV